MAFSTSDKTFNTIRSRFNWYWMRNKGHNGKQNRKAIKFAYKISVSGRGITIYWIKKNSDLQNPPSGPPIFFL